LFLIRLFIERGIKVFVSAWRGPEAAIRQIKELRKAIKKEKENSLVNWRGYPNGRYQAHIFISRRLPHVPRSRGSDDETLILSLES
jgi:hypothetical protein